MLYDRAENWWEWLRPAAQQSHKVWWNSDQRWNIQVRWFFYFFNIFFSSDRTPRPNTRPIWAYKRRGFVQGRISLSVRFTQDTNLEVFYPKRAQLPPGIGFPMLNAKSNCERTVRDRKVNPSANPTKSRTANRTQIIPLTLDWRLTCFSMSSSTKIQNRTAWKRLELGR